MSIIYTEPNMVNCIEGLPENVVEAFKRLLQSGLYQLHISHNLTWSIQDPTWETTYEESCLLQDIIPFDAFTGGDPGLAEKFKDELDRLSEIQMILHRKAMLKDDYHLVLDEEMKQWPDEDIYDW